MMVNMAEYYGEHGEQSLSRTSTQSSIGASRFPVPLTRGLFLHISLLFQHTL